MPSTTMAYSVARVSARSFSTFNVVVEPMEPLMVWRMPTAGSTSFTVDVEKGKLVVLKHSAQFAFVIPPDQLRISGS